MIFLKLKSAALQLTLFIAVVISILLMGFVLLLHTHKQFQIQTDFMVEATQNTDIGIDYAMRHTIFLKDTISVPLDETTDNTLKIYRDFWGIFERIFVVSHVKNTYFQKTALLGAKSKDQNRTALYLEETNKPLVVVGDTKIEGLVYLPKQGVKTGTIGGHHYTGSQLIYGPIKPATSLPKIASAVIEQIESIALLSDEILESQFIHIKPGKLYKNSFEKPVLCFYSKDKIDLNDMQLTGHFVVQSKTKITVKASSVLKDIVLIAPEIEIKNNVTGTFQAFATQKLQVGTAVQLEYPSALILNKINFSGNTANSSGQKEKPSLYIGDYSTIKGPLIYLGSESSNTFKTQVGIDAKALVIGELYCTQNTELKGRVYGSVFSKNFIANQFGSIYINHIYNGKINSHQLPKNYVGLLFETDKKEVLKWLY